MTAPDWTAHAIGWHVYPLGFTGAPVHPGDAPAAEPARTRLDHIADWLDYVQRLGLNMLQLGPVFASAEHGYDTLDYLRIDDRLGDDAAFDRLIAAAHERGIKVLLDGVFNHVSARHPLVADALADPGSPAARLIRVDRSGPEPRPAVFEGHDSLVELDHGSAEVAELVIGVMRHWLDRGADGWRLDAAYAVDPAFWARVLPQVRETHPHAFIYGEVIHGDYADIVARSTMDSVTEYELWKATWSALKEANLFELEWTLGRHDGFQDAFRPVTFVGNHDVTRIASRVGADKAVLAAVVLFTVGGIPLIYYGDEQGYTGVKEERFGGDDQIRPLFPPTPEDLSELGADMHRVHQSLVALRRRHPWLADARVTVTAIANEAMTYRTAAADGSAALEVTLDLTGAPRAEIRDGAEVIWAHPL
ncbi:alpha-amylase family protein [Corynebacterium sphenisci]|uniref:alpha-amylase family protein n=1 Tax=Corynebacterium sphenisci TaxID=191493 RepID=UPI0026E052A6|nr:alpha-amylase family protein [Corynebacterium sphenisci]MDO5730635.1 alpha-amylase family protein [Corynebacterium sphenisci]